MLSSMDDYPIRSITAEELPAFEEVLGLAFHGSGMDEHLKDDQLVAEPQLGRRGLYRAMGLPGRDPRNPTFCDACFTSDYPIALDDQNGVEDRQLSLLVESA